MYVWVGSSPLIIANRIAREQISAAGGRTIEIAGAPGRVPRRGDEFEIIEVPLGTVERTIRADPGTVSHRILF